MIEFEITQENVLAMVGGTTFVKLALVKRMHDGGKKTFLIRTLSPRLLTCSAALQIEHTVTPVHASRRGPVSETGSLRKYCRWRNWAE